MITFRNFPNVKFLNFKDVNEIDMFLNGKKDLFKYSLWNNAKKSLNKRYLWMSYPSKWKDPFEDYYLTAKYEDAKGNRYDFPFINNVFCNCLTPDQSSEAHWISYSKKNGRIVKGVCLRIIVKELVERLNNFGKTHPEYNIYIGKVSYLKLNEIQSRNINNIPLLSSIVNRDINDPDFCANLLLLKRNSFKHDNEIRIIFVRVKDKIKSPLDGVEFIYNYDKSGNIIKYQNDKLFSYIYVSPFNTQHEYESIRRELEKKNYCINKKTYKRLGKKSQRSRIQRSQLYNKLNPHIIKL